ncbi:MAG: AlpA family phage regulatory protein [Thermoanaerobaculia bacterium]|nr:AlpA family phage regulatory protein [Thermoanaerobaculia bacterium]
MTNGLVRYLRTETVLELTGVSRATIWRWMRAGLFPQRRKLGPNCIGWVETEVEAWLANRPVR